MTRNLSNEWQLVMPSFVRGRAGRRRTTKVACPCTRRLRFEPLEARQLLAITVNTLVDENNGIGVGGISLRDAIGAAIPGEVINFSVTGVIGLTGSPLSIGKSMTIQGPGANLLSIRPASASEEIGILSVGNGNASLIDVELSGLTLFNGSPPPIGAQGGAIANSENLTIRACFIHGNKAGATTGDAEGGGIYSALGSLTVIDSMISGNQCNGTGGGIYLQSGSLTITGSTIANNTNIYGGGGIYAKGSVTVTESTIRDNTSVQGGGGIDAAGAVTVTGSTIADNTAGAGFAGGGIRATGAGIVTVTDSIIRVNSAGSGGGIYRSNGGLNVSCSTIEDNHATNGGGIFADGIALGVSRSVISGNTGTSQGGGIYGHNGQMMVTDSTLTGNMASYGGGLLGRMNTMTIDRCTIWGNQSPNSNGGGIESVFATLNVNNSTLSGNTAGVGGGIFSYYSTTTVNHSTITDNRATIFGGGIRGFGVGSMNVNNTIVAGNLRGAGPTRDDAVGAMTANHSLIGDGSGATIFDGGGSQIGTFAQPIDPMLGPLADHGGLTFTHALLAGSLAIDRGDPALATPPTFDQRGNPFARIVDGDGAGGARIDIGAFEYILNDAVHALFGDYNRDDTVNAADYTVWRNAHGQTGQLAYSGADGNGDGMITQLDYDVWTSHYGQSPPGAGNGTGTMFVDDMPQSKGGQSTAAPKGYLASSGTLVLIDGSDSSGAAVAGEIAPPLAPRQGGTGKVAVVSGQASIGRLFISPPTARGTLTATHRAVTSPRRVTSDAAISQLEMAEFPVSEREFDLRDAALLAWFETPSFARSAADAELQFAFGDKSSDEPCESLSAANDSMLSGLAAAVLSPSRGGTSRP